MTIEVLGHSQCAYCKQALQFLATKGKSFQYLDAREPENHEIAESLRAEGVNQVPQVWIDGVRIGGFNELKNYIS